MDLRIFVFFFLSRWPFELALNQSKQSKSGKVSLFLSLYRRHLPSLFPTDTAVITITPRRLFPSDDNMNPPYSRFSPITPYSFRLVVEYPYEFKA
jgi:hypothetical protein